MERYIGLDAHSESCTIAVMDAHGKRLRAQVLETRAEVLIDFVTALGGSKQLCLEEGQLAEWLVEVLSPHVDEIRVTQPKKHAGRKSDADDAWTLAEQIRVRARGTYVFKPLQKQRPLREAVRAYTVAAKELTRAKNRLRALFRSRGVPELSQKLYQPKHRAEWIAKLPREFRPRAEWLGEMVDAMTKLHSLAEYQLESVAKMSVDVRRLTDLPGIGVIRAAQIVAIVVTPERFRTKRQFWSYCGLGIVTRSSSDWERNTSDASWSRRKRVEVRGLNRNRCSLLKSVFKGAALAAISNPTPLLARYDKLIADGIEPHLARLTIARSIAAAALAIWKKKEVYDPSRYIAPTAPA